MTGIGRLRRPRFSARRRDARDWRHDMKYMGVIAASALCGLLFQASECLPASVMAVGQDEGYSSKVMDKIVAKWSPPPQLKREYRLKLRIGLDGHGKLLECKAQRSSGLEALDASACAAVKAAAPFGDPPYGMPADIYLSFWTGGPQGRTPDDAADPSRYVEESGAAEARAAAMNAGAKAKAEQAAKSAGKQLPQASQNAPKGAKEQKEQKIEAEKPAPTQPKAVAAASAPAKSLPDKAEAPVADKKELAPKAEEKRVGDKNEVARETTEKPVLAQSRYDDKFAPYIAKVVRSLRNSMYIPMQTKPGTYYATAQVNFNKTGKITSCSIIKGSGDALLDKYVLQGINRAKRVPTPPEGIGDFLDLTFTLTRQ